MREEGLQHKTGYSWKIMWTGLDGRMRQREKRRLEAVVIVFKAVIIMKHLSGRVWYRISYSTSI